MSATVPLWVPLAVAGAGLVSTYGAAILTRWADRKDRRVQWQREDSLRWQQDRQQVYARLMAALDVWDLETNSVVAELKVAAQVGEDADVDVDEMKRLDTAASEVSALVQLMAPEGCPLPGAGRYMGSASI